MSDLKLSDVIARGVILEWHEGVAIVRGVTANLLASGAPRGIPELHQIVLAPTGQIDLMGGIQAEEPVRRLGQLLQATMGTAEPPVQLRLVISQATAPTPAYASIADYDEALGYYERPNREAVIKAVYDRAIVAAPVSDVQPAPQLDQIAPLPSADKPAGRKQPKRPRGKLRPAPFVAAALLVAIAGGSLYYLRVTGQASNTSDVAKLATRASESVGSAVVSGLSAVTERVGLGRLVSPDATPSPAPAPPANASDVKPTVVRRPGQPAVLVFDVDPKFVALPGTPSAAPSIAAAVRDDEPEEIAQPVGDAQIYSPTSAGVTPPVGKRMTLPKNLPTGTPGDLGSVELIIGPDGMVDSVKLVGAPRNVLDSLWLSALKAWQFEPAMKDGMPVRYRKTVWLAIE